MFQAVPIVLLSFVLIFVLSFAAGCAAPSDSGEGTLGPNPDRPLVGVSYFAGWWPESPNKWESGKPRADWRPRYPGRVPLLGEYNSQQVMDKEIVAAAGHGVDFFAILWYPPLATGKDRPEVLNRGLDFFVASPEAHRMKFMVEVCNHAPFLTSTDQEWDRCIELILPALKHPSCLRVDGRLVVKIHSGWQFWKDAGESASVASARVVRLRKAIGNAGLGEALVCIGGNMAPMPSGEAPVKFFDFTGEYMMVPPIPAKPTDYPYAELAPFIRSLRLIDLTDKHPYMPVLGAGWNPRPWPDVRACFEFPTRAEWVEALRAMDRDLQASQKLGIPRRDGTVARAFTIYAWNEFGEGGIVAPTRGEGMMKLQGIAEVFGPNHVSRSKR